MQQLHLLYGLHGDGGYNFQKMDRERKTALIVGVIFILATAASLVGSSYTSSILKSPDYLSKTSLYQTQIIIGVIFSFLAAILSACIAIFLYPILKKYNEGLAIGSVSFRIIEAVFYLIGVLCLLSLFSLSQEFVKTNGENIMFFQTLGSLLLAAKDISGFVLGAISFSIGGFMYYYIFYKSKLIPRWISIWGMIATLLMITASLLTLFDGAPYDISGNLLFLVIPIGLQEIVFAVWLIVKGFNKSAIDSLVK